MNAHSVFAVALSTSLLCLKKSTLFWRYWKTPAGDLLAAVYWHGNVNGSDVVVQEKLHVPQYEDSQAVDAGGRDLEMSHAPKTQQPRQA